MLLRVKPMANELAPKGEGSFLLRNDIYRDDHDRQNCPSILSGLM